MALLYTRRIHLFVLLPALLAGACAAPIPNARDSAESLAQAVLDAIERRDLDALHTLALNREEFTEHVWPELPSARPERNLSVGYVWGNLNLKSNLALQKTLAAHGGKKYSLVNVRFLGQTTPYKTYVVHRESALTVKDAEGRQRELRLFGSVLEKGGQYKVFSYVIDD